MQPYFQAKAQADAALEQSGLDHTIVRPGGLTDDPGTGQVTVAPELERGGQIPRDDVAAVLLAVLDAPNTIGKAFDLVERRAPDRSRDPRAVASPVSADRATRRSSSAFARSRRAG